jgi:hypothetical protein
MPLSNLIRDTTLAESGGRDRVDGRNHFKLCPRFCSNGHPAMPWGEEHDVSRHLGCLRLRSM